MTGALEEFYRLPMTPPLLRPEKENHRLPLLHCLPTDRIAEHHEKPAAANPKNDAESGYCDH